MRDTESDLDHNHTSPAAGDAAYTAAAAIWQLLLAARRLGTTLRSDAVATLSVTPDGHVADAGQPESLAVLDFHAGSWHPVRCRGAESLLALYLPLCASAAERPLVVAHLGQSLDGHIATLNGDSNYVTGAGNLDHLHRMRALADAIVIGAGTAALDDPLLTTRRVPGPSPVRVVIDPEQRLPADLRLFRDARAATIVLHATDCPPRAADAAGSDRPRQAAPAAAGVEHVAVPRRGAGIDLVAAVGALRARGLSTLFVEGGGRTVSAFLEAGLVDRLQLAIAPLVMGRGRPALTLPPSPTLADSLRPASRIFRMGRDVLFDCDLRATAATNDIGELPELIG